MFWKNHKERPRPGVMWAGETIPFEASVLHFFLMGTTGSGKTVLERLMMQSVLPLVGKGLDQRALIYDAKKDMHSILYGMGIEPRLIRTLNPFDLRGYAWKLAADITDPGSALELAHILVPERQENQPFFSDATRDLLSGVIESFIITAPEKWTFRAVIDAMLNLEKLKDVLSWTPFTQDRLEYLGSGQVAANIRSTIRTKLAPYRVIAACWSQAEKEGRTVSLEEWVNDPEGSILLLGASEKLKSGMTAVNRMLFKRLVELILDQEEDDFRRTWVFLDEVQELGKLDGLDSLLTNGRSKGAACVLLTQDDNGLRSVWGKELTDMMLAQCNHKIFLRLTSPSAASWAAEHFSYREALEMNRSTGESVGAQGYSTSTNWQEGIARRDAVIPQEFMTLPMTSRENGATLYGISPAFKNPFFAKHIPGQKLFAALCPKTRPEDNFHPRPAEHQYLHPLTKEEWDALKGKDEGPKLLPAPQSPINGTGGSIVQLPVPNLFNE